MNDPWQLILSGIIVAFVTYVLPKAIEGFVRRRITESEVEKVQEDIESVRWKKAQGDIKELIGENRRLRRLLREHGIDPAGSGPLKDETE